MCQILAANFWFCGLFAYLHNFFFHSSAEFVLTFAVRNLGFGFGFCSGVTYTYDTDFTYVSGLL